MDFIHINIKLFISIFTVHTIQHYITYFCYIIHRILHIKLCLKLCICCYSQQCVELNSTISILTLVILMRGRMNCVMLQYKNVTVKLTDCQLLIVKWSNSNTYVLRYSGLLHSKLYNLSLTQINVLLKVLKYWWEDFTFVNLVIEIFVCWLMKKNLKMN